MKRTLFVMLLCLCVSAVSFGQSYQATGVVTSEDDGLGLPGVNVSVKNRTGVGVTTDMDGRFKIQVAQGDILVFTYIGYATKEVAAQSGEPIAVVMQPEAESINEVVVVGYGTMRKSDLTGAVSSVKAKDLQAPVANLDQALQGLAAGVTVNANSGQPGAPAQVRVRGIGTINNAGPIYVVDGMIVDDISFLNSNDVESTEILKDASAAAIYGSRGANGVILITTKKGGGSDGNLRVTFNAFWGVQNRWHKLDLMKRDEFAATLTSIESAKSAEILRNNGLNYWLLDRRIDPDADYFPVVKSPENPNGFDYSAVETDWQDAVFVSNAVIQNYHFGVDGGTKKSTYSFSGSYFTQEGIVMGSDFSRLTVRVNSAHKIKPFLKIGENVSLVTTDARNAMNNNASPAASILSAAIAMAPWDPTHYPQGAYNRLGVDLAGQPSASTNFMNAVNPFSMVETVFPSDKAERLVGNVFLELTPIEGLVFRSDASLDLQYSQWRLFKQAHLFSSEDKLKENVLERNMARRVTMIAENILTYSKEIGEHSFSIMGGQTVEQAEFYQLSGSATMPGTPGESDWYFSKANKDSKLLGDAVSRNRRFSLLSRLHYAYGNKYLATFSIRADASSKFPLNPWGYFPSTALAWKINEESFLKEVEGLDLLKVRVGWGMLGNDKVGDNMFMQKWESPGPTFVGYVFGPDQVGNWAEGAAVLSWVNTGGTWETTEQWNAGLDFGLMKSRFVGSVDVYLRDTRDMLLPVKAPAQVGNRYDALANAGTVRNQGLELALTYNNRTTVANKSFNYSIAGNMAFVKNELTALNGGEKIWGNKTLTDQGIPLFSFYGYEYLGVYKKSEGALKGFVDGDPRFADLNGDGEIDDRDRKVLGDAFPWLTYGLTLSADWNNFDFQLFMQGVYGNQLYNAMRERTEGTGIDATLSTTMRDVWTKSNPNGSIPNPSSAYHAWTSSRYVESGAFLRLKNIQIGYSLPHAWLQKAGIEKCRFYILANNLLTITPYTGYDPEVGGYNGIDYGNYPQARTVSLGVNLTF